MDPYEERVTAIVRDTLALIAKWRGRRGLSRYATGRKARVARQTLANLEHTLAGDADAPKRGPQLAMVARLWLALGIPGRALGEIFHRHAARRPSRPLD